ncbi:MAG: hypothetical protein V3S70_00845 [Gammaproteobacteria bacterium]
MNELILTANSFVALGSSAGHSADQIFGIVDPEALLDEFCKRSPDAFCADD